MKFWNPALRTSSLTPPNGDHDVTAASRPVKAFVPVQIRLVTPLLSNKTIPLML